MPVGDWNDGGRGCPVYAIARSFGCPLPWRAGCIMLCRAEGKRAAGPIKSPLSLRHREDNSFNEQPIFPPPGGRPFPIVFAAGLAFIAGGFGLQRGGYGYPGTGRHAGTDAPGPGCGYGRAGDYADSAGYAGHCGYRYGGGGGRFGGGGNGRRANGNPGAGGYGRAGSYGYRCDPADADGCAYAAAFAGQYAYPDADRCAAAAHWYANAAAYAGIAADPDSGTGGYRHATAADRHAGTDAGSL